MHISISSSSIRRSSSSITGAEKQNGNNKYAPATCPHVVIGPSCLSGRSSGRSACMSFIIDEEVEPGGWFTTQVNHLLVRRTVYLADVIPY